jgi:hypothetical protein
MRSLGGFVAFLNLAVAGFRAPAGPPRIATHMQPNSNAMITAHYVIPNDRLP